MILVRKMVGHSNIPSMYRPFHMLWIEHVVLRNKIHILSLPGISSITIKKKYPGFFIPSLIGNSKPLLETSFQVFFILTFIPPAYFSYLYKV